MMPRLTRKIGHLTGEMSQITSSSKRNTFSAQVSVYDNNASIHTIRKEKYTLVRNPLRTKMSTMTPANMSKSLLISGRGDMSKSGSNDAQTVLRDLKQLQKEKIMERREQQQQYSVTNKDDSVSSNTLPAIRK